MNVLLIGGSGFMGPPLASQLLAQGHRVAVLHRGGSKAPLPPNAERILADRNRLAESRASIARFAPDVAALPSVAGHATAES